MGQLIGSGTCSCIEQVYSAVASYVASSWLYLIEIRTGIGLNEYGRENRRRNVCLVE